MERMVLDRLNWYLETNTKAFHPAQTGFRANMGTQESLFLISRDMSKTDKPLGTDIKTIVAIDVRKAFDSVPHASVIREAIKLGVHGRALNFIKSFLENRTYSIRYGDFTSAPARNGVGVPQGSVLSPLLFNIAMANLPKLLHKIPNLKFTVYADDVTIWTTHGDLTTQQSTLQSGLDAVDSHLNEVGLRASSEKTTYMVVASRKQRIADVKNRIVLSL